jgi:hypothetical protein
MGHQISFKHERLRRRLKPRRSGRVNSARGLFSVVKLSHEGALDACYLSSLDFSHLKRAVQAEGPERASTAQDFQFRKRFFKPRHALQIHSRWFEFAKLASLLMRIAPATGNEGDFFPPIPVEEEPNFREHWAQT